jgi:cytoskeleton protein RodZ
LDNATALVNVRKQRTRQMALLQRIKPSLAGNGPEKQSPASPGLRSAGDALRQQREGFNLDLPQVAAALKIKPAYLAAIETGRTDLLPGAAYAVGFIRAYTTYLGLDSAEILRRFKLETSGFDAKPDLTFPAPLGKHSVPGGGMLLVSLILAICGYGAWYSWSAAERPRLERVREVPVTLLPPELKSPKTPVVSLPPASAPAPGGISSALVGSPSAASKDQPKPSQTIVTAELSPSHPPASAGSTPSESSSHLSVAANSNSAPPASASVPPPAPRAPAEPASATPTAPDPAVPPAGDPTEALAAPPPSPEGQSPRVFGAAAGPSRVVLRANIDSWIQIRDADRTVLFAGLLKPGDAYRVPDRQGLTMRAGNAGGLDILVDGKPAPSLGPMGAVRNVSLDPQSIMAEGGIHD